MGRGAVFLSVLAVLTFAAASSEKNCDYLGTLLYDDIGCKPVMKDGHKCPVKYDCRSFQSKNNTCLFKGKYYELGASPGNLAGLCNMGCVCNTGNKFSCAILECSEWFGLPVTPGCYRKYDDASCCSSGENCPSEENKFSECALDGETFKEGERFFPKESCSRCVCSKNFNGTVSEQSCTRYSCAMQLEDNSKLEQKCAPFYWNVQNDRLCCPHGWVCPSSNDTFTTLNSNADKNSDMACEFGTSILQLGEGFEKEIYHFGRNKTARCECVLPPLMTCIEVPQGEQ